MNTSYDAWARFDVEKELARVDLRAQQEEQERQARKQAQAKRSVEDSVAQSSEDAAEILAAQAAVAALKAKRKGRCGPRNANLPAKPSIIDASASEKAPGETEAADDEGEAAERLMRKAQLLKRRHELLQQIVMERRGGEAMLEAGEGEKALPRFEAALEATRALEAMLPELSQEEAQEQREATDSAANGGEMSKTHDGHDDTKNHGHHDHHHDGGNCSSHGCKHNQQSSEPVAPAALPKPTDLKAVIEMFYKDVYMGVGACQTRAKRYSLASEAFKEVLVRDGSHLKAWMLRGGAFEAMGAPLLAMLHYTRVTTLAPNDDEGNKALEEIKRKLFDEGADLTDAQQREEPATPGNALTTIAETFQQGAVVMTEGFYDYAVRKFKTVLHMLEEIKQHAESPESRSASVKPEVLRQLEVAANMNIAGASLEMQRDYGVALSHCARVLALDPDHVMCHFRMGQLLRASHKYEQAIAHLERAQRLLRAQSQQRTTQFAEVLAKEMEKAHFDRGQYDHAFVKAAASRAKKSPS